LRFQNKIDKKKSEKLNKNQNWNTFGHVNEGKCRFHLLNILSVGTALTVFLQFGMEAWNGAKSSIAFPVH
jgi:hypothetical protein